MVHCPNCHAENRSGAKYCKNCATRLPITSAVTRPLDLDEDALAAPLIAQPGALTPPGSGQATRRLVATPRSGTQPLRPADPFARRPSGAVFVDSFLYDNAIFSDENQHRYLVHQVDVPEDMQLRACPNPVCGAIFLPRMTVPERFCTDCGTVLERGGRDLVIIEARAPIPDNIVRVAAKGLSHGAVRAPLAVFVERLGGVSRHCVVVARVTALEPVSDAIHLLRWGIRLARGLDYLHDNGVGFGGRVDAAALGMVNHQPVWANFTNCLHHPDGYVTERKPDADALAALLYLWMAGKSRYEIDPAMPLALNQALERIFNPPGVESAGELADLYEQALEELATVTAIDFYMGRRTHVGMVRTLNEDSIMTLEMNRIHQSISQPLGVYVVADGMGGHAAGEVASGTIINVIAQKALKDLLPDDAGQVAGDDRQRWLRTAVESANEEVFILRKKAGTDMGSTLVAAVLEGNQGYITHIGDSRAYLINTTGIRRLTIDHSLVERLIATNQITREEARVHPQRNVIYRTVGDKTTVEVEVSRHTFEVGDYLLLCSDGLSGMVDDATLRRLVLAAASPQAACDALIRAANDAGGDDNISVIIVQIVEA